MRYGFRELQIFGKRIFKYPYLLFIHVIREIRGSKSSFLTADHGDGKKNCLGLLSEKSFIIKTTMTQKASNPNIADEIHTWDDFFPISSSDCQRILQCENEFIEKHLAQLRDIVFILTSMGTSNSQELSRNRICMCIELYNILRKHSKAENNPNFFPDKIKKTIGILKKRVARME